MSSNLEYRLIAKVGEGTFSEVIKAQSIRTGKYVAIKCMKKHFNSIEQVNNLREIQALRKLSPYPHIVKLIEILYDEPTGRLALVFELMESNLYQWIESRGRNAPESKVKFYIFQILKSLHHMHSNMIFHRDIKPENVLVMDDVIKLADFGSCRGISAKAPLTEYISTRWYRSPECLLTDGYYNFKMDIWGVGCIWFEALTGNPLFAGRSELDQINKIHEILGTPPQELLDEFQKKASHIDFNFTSHRGIGLDRMFPNVSPLCRDLIKKMLTYDPEKRVTAKECLKHAYFREMYESENQLAIATTPNSIQTTDADIAAGDESSKVQEKTILPPIKQTAFQTKPKGLMKPNASQFKSGGWGNDSIKSNKKSTLSTLKPFISPTYKAKN